MENPYALWDSGQACLIGIAGLVVGGVVGGLLAAPFLDDYPKLASLIFAVVAAAGTLPSFFVDRRRG